MIITQTVEIPADRRLTIDVPREVPTGSVILTFKPMEQDTTEYLLSNPATRERLLKSIKDSEEGKNCTIFETLEDAIKAAEEHNRKK